MQKPTPAAKQPQTHYKNKNNNNNNNNNNNSNNNNNIEQPSDQVLTKDYSILQSTSPTQLFPSSFSSTWIFLATLS